MNFLTKRVLTDSNSQPISIMIANLRRSLVLALTTAALAFVPISATAQTLSLPDSDLPTSGFGKGATPTFGQTFTAPAAYLQSFSFWLSNDPGLTANPGSLLFQAYVMRWDATNGYTTGPVLYTSAVQTGPTAFSSRYNFAATNVLLNPSMQYVAFLSASSQLANIGATDANAVMETSFLGTYTGGQFVFTDNGANLATLSTTPWDFTGLPEYQSHFEATFTSAAVSVVPEPSSLMLLLSGAMAVLVVAMKKKRV